MNLALHYVPRLIIFALLMALTVLDWHTAVILRLSIATQNTTIDVLRKTIETQKQTIEAQDEELAALRRTFAGELSDPLDIPDRPPAADFAPKPKPPEAP